MIKTGRGPPRLQPNCWLLDSDLEPMGSFSSPNDESLRQAAWLSHLGFGRGPILELMPDLHPCYSEEIARAASGNTQADRDFRQDNLSDHLVILYLWGGLPHDLLEQF